MSRHRVAAERAGHGQTRGDLAEASSPNQVERPNAPKTAGVALPACDGALTKRPDHRRIEAGTAAVRAW